MVWSATCDIPEFTCIIKYFGFGIKSSYWQTQETQYLISVNKNVRSLRKDDIVLASAGVHWSRFCHAKASALNIKFRDERFELYLQNLLSNLVDPEHTDHCGRQGRDRGPMILWRESLPQHFPSSNGIFFPVSINESRVTHCQVMTAEMYGGHSHAHETTTSELIGTCEPNCLPVNWQNVIANKFVSGFCIPVVPVFDALVCQHDHHDTSGDPGDCTHYDDTINTFLNERFLQQWKDMLH